MPSKPQLGAGAQAAPAIEPGRTLLDVLSEAEIAKRIVWMDSWSLEKLAHAPITYSIPSIVALEDFEADNVEVFAGEVLGYVAPMGEFAVRDESTAEWCLNLYRRVDERLAALNAARQNFEARFHAEVRSLYRERDRLDFRFRGDLELFAAANAAGQTLNLPSGTLGWRNAPSPSVKPRISDAWLVAYCRAAGFADLVESKVRYTVSTTKLAKVADALPPELFVVKPAGQRFRVTTVPASLLPQEPRLTGDLARAAWSKLLGGDVPPDGIGEPEPGA
jgi:hypothetical protein